MLSQREMNEVKRIYEEYGEDWCEPAYKLFCKVVADRLGGIIKVDGTIAATPGIRLPVDSDKDFDLFFIEKYVNKFRGILTGGGVYNATPCYCIGRITREGIRVSEEGFLNTGYSNGQIYYNDSRIIFKPELSQLFNRFKRYFDSCQEYLKIFDETVSRVIFGLKSWINTLDSKKASLNRRSSLMNTRKSNFSINRKAGFNGWANYPTWYLNLYLIEDEDPDTLEEFVKDVLEDSDREYPEAVLAEALEDRAKEYIYDLDNIPSDGLGSTLIQYALGQVDFMEISKHLYKLAQERGWLEEADED